MKKKKIESYLGLARRAGKIVSGYQTCVHTISKGNIKLIIVASDASENTRDRFKNLCRRSREAGGKTGKAGIKAARYGDDGLL